MSNLFDLRTLAKLSKQGGNIITRGSDIVQRASDFVTGSARGPGGNGRFGLNTFMSEFVRRDPALTSHFFVTIPTGGKESRMVAFSCAGAELPGVTFNTTETRRFGVGPLYSYPTSTVNAEVQFSFMCDSSGVIQDFFHSWMHRIFSFDTTSDAPFYVASYKREYAVDIKIELFNRKKDLYYTYTFINAYPMTVGNAQVGWENSQILCMPVSFRYDSYKFEQASAEPGKDGFLSAANIPIVQGVRDILRIPQQIRDIQNQVNRTSDILGSIGGNIMNNVRENFRIG